MVAANANVGCYVAFIPSKVKMEIVLQRRRMTNHVISAAVLLNEPVNDSDYLRKKLASECIKNHIDV